MTKKELRTMYDKMSLSEERMTELEKRLDDCFEHEPENIGDFEETELMQFSQEYKPAPQRRNPLKIVVTSAAGGGCGRRGSYSGVQNRDNSYRDARFRVYPGRADRGNR